MLIPKTLKVGTVTYSVTRKRIKRAWGETDFCTSTITLSTYIHKQYEGGTFLHEIFEVINFQNNIGITHKDISVMAEAVYTVLTENKLLRESK